MAGNPRSNGSRAAVSLARLRRTRGEIDGDADRCRGQFSGCLHGDVFIVNPVRCARTDQTCSTTDSRRISLAVVTPAPPGTAVLLYLRTTLRSVVWRRDGLFYRAPASAILAGCLARPASISPRYPSSFTGCSARRGRFPAGRRSTWLWFTRSAAFSAIISSLNSMCASSPRTA